MTNRRANKPAYPTRISRHMTGSTKPFASHKYNPAGAKMAARIDHRSGRGCDGTMR